MFIAATIAALIVAPAFAQQRPPSNMEASLAPGLVWHGAIFGDDDPKTAGAVRLTVSGIVRGQIHQVAGFTFEGTIEPMGIANPHFDEHLHSLHALAGVEIGRGLTVRPSIGAAVQVWSGRNAESGISIAPAVGIAIGAYFARGDRACLDDARRVLLDDRRPGAVHLATVARP